MERLKTDKALDSEVDIFFRTIQFGDIVSLPEILKGYIDKNHPGRTANIIKNSVFEEFPRIMFL